MVKGEKKKKKKKQMTPYALLEAERVKSLPSLPEVHGLRYHFCAEDHSILK